jgi:L-ribulose-5-phosphate 4-epimerase
MLEFAAEMAMMAVTINPRIRGVRQSLLDKHYLRKHGTNAYYGQGGGHG